MHINFFNKLLGSYLTKFRQGRIQKSGWGRTLPASPLPSYENATNLKLSNIFAIFFSFSQHPDSIFKVELKRISGSHQMPNRSRFSLTGFSVTITYVIRFLCGINGIPI